MQLVVGLLLIAAVVCACGGESDEDEVKSSLVRRTFEVINKGDASASGTRFVLPSKN